MNMTENESSLLEGVKISRVFFPVAIGLGVVAYMFYKEFDPESFKQVTFENGAIFWFLAAFMLMFARDAGYVIRLKILSGPELSWMQAVKVVVLWEFTSAITPSAIGGTSVAILYVHKEGISVGKSTAVVLATSFLDELYFLLMFPLLFFVIEPSALFAISHGSKAVSFANEFFYFAVIGYLLKFLFTSLVSYGLFMNPRGIKQLINWVFQLPILRKWKYSADKVGNDIVLASGELRSKGIVFWLKSFVATLLSWTSRYWVVNCLFLVFFAVDDHFLVFARQLVMWIMMLVSPTPGGSGFAEYVFSEYLGDFIPFAGFAVTLAFLWRIISYYLYLLLGVFVFPRWVNEKFRN